MTFHLSLKNFANTINKAVHKNINIGICWRGSENLKGRSLDLSNFKKISQLKNINLNDYFKKDEFYSLFEVFKKPGNVAILLDTTPSILASLAPPLWMLQNRLWTYFCITMTFYFMLLMISPWLFFIGWILKSWYVGNSQIDLLRFFYRLRNYRLSLSFCARSDKEAQEIARKFDEKVDFYFSYLEPVIIKD